jgi:rhodanese-related sulfurtransferase/DNA-binding transcriptional ArsR family regulator
MRRRAETPGREFKEQVYAQFARVGRALSSPARLELLDLLVQAPRTVDALAQAAHLSLANCSQHLHVLRGAGLVESRKSGLHVTYRLASPEVGELYRGLRGVAQARLADLDHATRDFFDEREALQPVRRAEVLSRAKKGEIVLLDVRPQEEYDAEHLKGAVSIPVAELRRRLDELPRRKDIVAYCRGPYCVFAVDAVRLLRSRGFRAFPLEDGVLEWRAAGSPLESSPREAVS